MLTRYARLYTNQIEERIRHITTRQVSTKIEKRIRSYQEH